MAATDWVDTELVDSELVDSEIESTVHGLTRLVRASALLVAQGMAIGFLFDTVLLWSRLGEFVSTNRMSSTERLHVLGWLMLPAVLWTGFLLAFAALRRSHEPRLVWLERAAQRSSWLVAVGPMPVLLHPTLWRTRTLMFLLATAAVTLAVWWAIRVSQKGLRRGSESSWMVDLRRMGAFLNGWLPLRVQVLAPLGVIALAVLYTVGRGIWLDAAAVPKAPGDPPVTIHSLRQAFSLLGHGGWLGLPVVMIKVLRPPSHAHLLFWASCVTAAAFPLYAWVRRHLGKPVGLMVALAYLSMPMMRTLGRSEVFPLGIAAGLFFAAAVEWDRRRYAVAATLTLLTVGIHEQAALWFTCLGIYLTSKRASTSLGRWLTAASLGYFALVAFWVLPALDLDPYRDSFRGLWSPSPVGLLTTLKVAVANPAYVLSRWIEMQGLSFWLALFVPFAFLPVASRAWLLWALPGVVFAVVGSGHMPSLPVTVGANAHFIVLGFTASVLGLAELRARRITRHHANAAVFAWAFALVPCVYQLGGLWLPAP